MHPKLERKQREIIEAFNSKPKNGIQKIKELLINEELSDFFLNNTTGLDSELIRDYLKSSESENAQEIAEFFFNNRRNLNLDHVGDYLGDDGSENAKVLVEFTSMIDFNDQNFTESLRTFLKSFKLPGEAQKIDRLMESFGMAFHKQNPGVLKNDEAAYLLAYQTIMINTNLHNPCVKPHEKYTIDSICSILRGGNGGEDFPRELIQKIFDEIKATPFEFNFAKTAPGYVLNSTKLKNDPIFKKIDSLLQSTQSPQDVFSNIGPDVKSTIDKPSSWLNILTGYEGTIKLTDTTSKAAVTIQLYKPSIFSKLLFGEKPRVIIQPEHKEGIDSKASLDLAAKVTANFQAEATVKSIYNYEKEDLIEAYQKNKQELITTASRKFVDQYQEIVTGEEERHAQSRSKNN